MNILPDLLRRACQEVSWLKITNFTKKSAGLELWIMPLPDAEKILHFNIIFPIKMLTFSRFVYLEILVKF